MVDPGLTNSQLLGRTFWLEPEPHDTLGTAATAVGAKASGAATNSTTMRRPK